MIERFLVMVQREVGERLAAVPGTKAYGAVSVKVAYYARRRGGRARCRPSVFVPKPKVDSALVRLRTARRAAGRGRRSRAHVRARARRVRDPPQDAAPRARRPSSATDADATLRRGRDRSRGARPRRSTLAAVGRARADASTRVRRRSARSTRTRSSRSRCTSPGTRADGYHELDALVVSVSEPHDELVIRPATAPSLIGDRSARRRAFRPTTRTSRCAPRSALGANVDIELHKGIPTGAGLGGGSADAAAVLIGAPQVAGLDVHCRRPRAHRGRARRRRAVLPAAAARCAMRGIGDDLEPGQPARRSRW